MEDKEKAQKLYLFGVNHLNQQCDVEALSCLYQSFELREHQKTAFLISQILDKNGQDKIAFEFLEKAYSLGTNNDLIAFSYANQLVRYDLVNQAMWILQEILKRNQSYQKARILLEQISSS